MRAAGRVVVHEVQGSGRVLHRPRLREQPVAVAAAAAAAAAAIAAEGADW